MSKSASDSKVEDVLSSVRRLVSNELPRKPRPSVPDGPGALVLTEAHRVESGAGARVASKSLEERIAELEAAVGGGTEEFEPDGSEDQAQHRPDRIVYTRPPTSDEMSAARRSTLRLSQIALIDTGPANDDEAEAATPAFQHDTPRENDEAPMAVDVPLPEPSSAEVAAFTDPDDVARLIEARLNSDDDPVEPIAAEDAGALDTEEADPSIGDADFEKALSAAVAASVADKSMDTIGADEFEDGDKAEEAADGGFSRSNPAGPGEDDEAGEGDEIDDGPAPEMDGALEFPAGAISGSENEDADLITDISVDAPFGAPDQAAPEVPEKAPSPEVPEAQAEKTPDSPSVQSVASEPTDAGVEAATAVLAELPEDDAMRLLVSRLIREELQGELGERITRNVRKLVRREIKRALTSQDLT